MFGDPLGGLLFGGETLDYFRLAIGPKNIDHPAKSGITFSRHQSGSVFGHLANMRLRRPGSSRSSDNNQTDRPKPAVDGNTAPAKAAREGLATARPVVFAGRCHPVAPPSPRVSSLLRHLAYVPGVVGGRLLQVGLLTKDTHRNTIRFAPPLIIRESQVDRAVGKLTEVLEELASSSVQAQHEQEASG
jgi:hypothetical protein